MNACVVYGSTEQNSKTIDVTSLCCTIAYEACECQDATEQIEQFMMHDQISDWSDIVVVKISVYLFKWFVLGMACVSASSSLSRGKRRRVKQH